MDFASWWRAITRQRRNRARFVQVRHAAVLGDSRQSVDTLHRHDSFHSTRVAGKTASQDRRLCVGRGVWTWFQRGISPTAMGLSVYLYLALLAAVGVLRLVE